MGKVDWKPVRISLEWGTFFACVIALIQGAGSLQTRSIVALALLGGGTAVCAVMEHRWNKVHSLPVIALIIVGVVGLAFGVWPKPQTAVIAVAPRAVTIKWDDPAPITAGSSLSKTQLNATATNEGNAVEGGFVYNPAMGTTLQPGTQTLSVKFTPNELSAYLSKEKTVTIVVVPVKSIASKSPILIDRSQSVVRVDNNGGQITGFSVNGATISGENTGHNIRSLDHFESTPGRAIHDVTIDDAHLCNINSWDDFLDCVAADPHGVRETVDYQRDLLIAH
jgi:hypothetical protein